MNAKQKKNVYIIILANLYIFVHLHGNPMDMVNKDNLEVFPCFRTAHLWDKHRIYKYPHLQYH